MRVDVGRWPLARPLATSSVTANEVSLISVTIEEGALTGRGEAAGVYYRGETVEFLSSQLEAVRREVEAGLARESLQARLPAGGARNALDCALWELEARAKQRSVAELAGVVAEPLVTAATISLDRPDAMAREAEGRRAFRVLKLKLGTDDPVACVQAVRSARPDARLIADANAAWPAALFERLADRLAAAGLEMIEQPCPLADDARLGRGKFPLAVCADESCHDRNDLSRVGEYFDMINIKLDKTGGLTEALALAHDARRRGLGLMVGNMLGTCLAMAPASLLGGWCRYVDIDGPVLLARDRPPGMVLDGDVVTPLVPSVWG